MSIHTSLLRGIALCALLASTGAATAQNKQFSFAYDQPKTSAYGFGADVFGKRLSELSKGTLSTNQYAAYYRINPASVAKAFQQLVDEQVLYKKRGIGMFVT